MIKKNITINHAAFEELLDMQPSGLITETIEIELEDGSFNQFGQNNFMFGRKGKLHPSYGRKHTEETKLLMKTNHWDMKGKNHPKAKAIIINGIQYDTKEEAKKVYGMNDSSIKQYLKGIGWIIDGKYFPNIKRIADHYNVSRSIVKSYLNKEISNIEYPKCKVCNCQCKSIYLYNRWHKNCE